MSTPKHPQEIPALPPRHTEATPPSPQVGTFSEEQTLRIDRTLADFQRIHQQLSHFLQRPALKHFATLAGGDHFLRAELSTTSESSADGFVFDYIGRKMSFTRPFLWALSQARQRLGPAWEEFVRLFLLHEGYHIGQRLTGYSYRGIGRAGFVLEGIDYDADSFSVQACLEWRRDKEQGYLRDKGVMAVLAEILRTVLGGISAFDEFEGRFPLRELPERRLRRYLIWHLQHARADCAPRQLTLKEFGLGRRVIVEAPGIPLRMEERSGTLRSIALLSELSRASELEIAIYTNGRLFRSSAGQALEVLEALRENNLDRVKSGFFAMFFSMGALAPWLERPPTGHGTASAAAARSPAPKPPTPRAAAPAPAGVVSNATGGDGSTVSSVGIGQIVHMGGGRLNPTERTDE
ncbi:MAG TPA: hypothetical protein VNA24_30075 [Hyalangium sp.]|jgi:hypothetical protein|nr:hypothetical protein [Hyalangium sp.]